MPLDGGAAALCCHVCGREVHLAVGTRERVAALRALVQEHASCDAAAMPQPRAAEGEPDPLDA